MGTIISITAQKGGVGKTATTLNLGVAMAEAGHSVLLIDADPKAGLSAATGHLAKTPAGLAQLLSHEANRDEVVTRSDRLPLSMAHLGMRDPARIFWLAGKASTERLAALSSAIRSLAADYDFVLTDTPGCIGKLQATLLTASDAFIIPTTCRHGSIRSLPMLLRLCREIREKLNPDLTLLGLLIQMFDFANPNELDVLAAAREAFPRGAFFNVPVPRAAVAETAEAHQAPLAFLSGTDEIREAYASLARDVSQRLEFTRKGARHEHPPETLF